MITNAGPWVNEIPCGSILDRPQQLTFESARARQEYPWAERFVMGLPLAPWQRKFEWTEEQSLRFITSAWTGVHLGTYVLTEIEVGTATSGAADAAGAAEADGVEYAYLSNCVIDGQQRLTSLELYVTNRLSVPDNTGVPTLWAEVSARDQRRFENTIFSCGTVRDRDEQRLRSLYDLMNFSGTPHAESDRATLHDAEVPDPQGEAPRPG